MSALPIWLLSDKTVTNLSVVSRETTQRLKLLWKYHECIYLILSTINHISTVIHSAVMTSRRFPVPTELNHRASQEACQTNSQLNTFSFWELLAR